MAKPAPKPEPKATQPQCGPRCQCLYCKHQRAKQGKKAKATPVRLPASQESD